MLFINSMFFALTVAKICTLDEEQRKLNLRNHNARSEKMDRFWLFFKLFLGMGILWVFELIAGFLDEYVSEYVFYFTDTLNLLQGVYVFAIFVCKRAVFDDILKFLKLDKYFQGNQSTMATNLRLTKFKTNNHSQSASGFTQDTYAN